MPLHTDDLPDNDKSTSDAEDGEVSDAETVGADQGDQNSDSEAILVKMAAEVAKAKTVQSQQNVSNRNSDTEDIPSGQKPPDSPPVLTRSNTDITRDVAASVKQFSEKLHASKLKDKTNDAHGSHDSGISPSGPTSRVPSYGDYVHAMMNPQPLPPHLQSSWPGPPAGQPFVPVGPTSPWQSWGPYGPLPWGIPRPPNMHPEIATRLQHIYPMSTSDISRSGSGFGVVTNTSFVSSVAGRERASSVPAADRASLGAAAGRASGSRDRSTRASSVVSNRSAHSTASSRVRTPAEKKQARRSELFDNALPSSPSDSLLRRFEDTTDE